MKNAGAFGKIVEDSNENTLLIIGRVVHGDTVGHPTAIIGNPIGAAAALAERMCEIDDLAHIVKMAYTAYEKFSKPSKDK